MWIPSIVVLDESDLRMEMAFARFTYKWFALASWTFDFVEKIGNYKKRENIGIINKKAGHICTDLHDVLSYVT